MTKLEHYDIYYDGQDPRQSAHIYERIDNQPAQLAALCGAARPANQRAAQQATRPPNPVCRRCERRLTQREGLPLNPPRRS
jgi:hypothetical protein